MSEQELGKEVCEFGVGVSHGVYSGWKSVGGTLGKEWPAFGSRAGAPVVAFATAGCAVTALSSPDAWVCASRLNAARPWFVLYHASFSLFSKP